MLISNDVLTVISAATVVGNTLMLNGQLDRNLYTKTNKVLDAAGGKWDRKKKAHIFDGDAADRIDQIILSGRVEIPKDDFEYFPSPPEVVNRLIELAEIKDEMLCLEPSAGQGAIVKGIQSAANDVSICMIELNQANCDVLFDLHIPLRIGALAAKDFLDENPVPNFDRVIMNPPFGRQADIKHVMHAFKFLKPGGRLVSVMSAGVTFRENSLTKSFREFVDLQGGFIEPLPEKSFVKSGTSVNTVIVVLDK